MRLWQLQALILAFFAAGLWLAHVAGHVATSVHAPHMAAACKVTKDAFVAQMCAERNQ